MLYMERIIFKLFWNKKLGLLAFCRKAKTNFKSCYFYFEVVVVLLI